MKSRIVSMAAGAIVFAAAAAIAQQPTTQQTAQASAAKQPAQPQAVQPHSEVQKGVAHGQGHGAKGVAKYLELTPEQHAGWKKIQAETDAVVKPLRDKILAFQNQLTDQTKAAKPDSAEIAKLTQSIRDLQTQVWALRDQSNVKFAALLTPAQKTKFQEFEAAAKARRAAREQQQR